MILILAAIIGFLMLTFGSAWFFVRNDRGSKEPVTMLWAAFAFGLLAVVLTLAISWLFIPDTLTNVIDPESTQTPSILFVFCAAMMVGIIEETAKAIPLAFFIFKKNYFNEHTDGVIYFALSGLCFSLIEDFLYTMSYGGGVGLTRLLVGPFTHAALSGIFGFYLARYKITGKSKRAVILALVGAITLHGLFDFGLFTKIPILMVLSLMIAAAVNVSLFIFFFEARRLDQNIGLSAVGINKFCRHCGTANKERDLYCKKCGKKT